MYIFSVSILLFFLDFTFKKYSAKHLKWNGKINVSKILEIIYVENRGIAFNLLENQKKLILISNFFLLSYILYLYWSLEVYRFPLMLIFCGGFGNFFDRIKNGFVIDYICFKIKKIPVFNLSDFYIIIGAILFAI